jgi:hypothetical protein
MLLYTFRTAPFKEKLLEMNTKIFVFGRLKEDFKILSKKILEERPDYVIGMAASNTTSQFESNAINQFNNSKKIVHDGEKHLPLHIPENAIFPTSQEASDTFCNWTAYKIAKLIQDNKLETKMVFTHIKHEDVDLFLNSLSKM